MKLNGQFKKSITGFLPYLYAPAAVAAILLAVFIAKGIYPFGTNTVDYADMGQMNAPMYYHLYDAMHGTKSLFFDWYTGLGINMAESVSFGGFLSPFNLFFYFIPRNSILQNLSLLTLIKMAAMAAAMFVFLHKKFSSSVFWKVLFAAGYAFSGFALQYYTNSQWLDIAAMFPLLILGLDRLFHKKQMALYIVMLTMCLLANMYCSAMILMFLFFIGGLYILLLAPGESKREQILLLGMGTLLSAGLSACVVLPAYRQMAESTRMLKTKTGPDIYASILGTVNYQDMQKWLMLFGTALAVVVIAKGMTAAGKEKRTAALVIGSLLIIALPIGFENINLIWHGGSYMLFPLRFGYMISFVFLSAGCYYAGKIPHLKGQHPEQAVSKRRIIVTSGKIILGLCLVALMTAEAVRVYKKIPAAGYAETVFKWYRLIFFVLLAVYTTILLKRNRLLNYRWISVFTAAEMLLGAYVFISPPADKINSTIEQHSDYIQTANELKQKLNILPSRLDRIKNIGNTLNSNYPFILQKAAVSNWTHSVSGGLQTNLRNLGYSTVYTRLNDSGGTVFSDALLNIKQTLSACELDKTLYTPVSGQQTYHLYNNTCTLPLGITVPGSLPLLNRTFSDCFEYQNALFEQLSGQKELIHSIKTNGSLDTSVITETSPSFDIFDNKTEYTLNIQGNKVLYFYSSQRVSGMTFYVKGKVVPVPSIGRDDNTEFPTSFNSGLLCLGAFKDETVSLKIVHPGEISEDGVNLGLLDLDKLKAFTQSYNGYDAHVQSTNRSLSLTVSGSAEKPVLFLPVAYDPGWSCTVNGQKTAVEKAANSFIGVQLQPGVNSVKLTFVPAGVKTGTVISLITLLLLIAGFAIRKKRTVKIPELIQTGVAAAFILVWSLGLIIVYLIPVGTTALQKLLLN